MRSPHGRAPGLLGAFLFASLLLKVVSCEDKPLPRWPSETIVEELSTPPPESEKADKPRSTHGGKEFRFIAYNLKNWLEMDRYEKGQPNGVRSKPEKEKNAVITLISRHQPDILGVCEIGTKDDLEDLRRRLASNNIDLPHTHHTGGGDDTRHLAILTRFPILSTIVHDNLPYKLIDRKNPKKDRGFQMSRGILDAVLDTPAGPIRFLGVHLKSKREIPEADQELMRQAEAHLLRDHAEAILKDDPNAKLVVYGDLNDSRQSSALLTIRRPSDGPHSLNLAALGDSRGEYWTHHWSHQDIYSRFDYILVSNAMMRHVDWDKSRILDDPEWADASDHRALLMIFTP